MISGPSDMCRFERMLAQRRCSTAFACSDMSNILTGMSSGRQPHIGTQLCHSNANIALVAGSEDAKFVKLAHSMLQAMTSRPTGKVDTVTSQLLSGNTNETTMTNVDGTQSAAMFEVRNCGHAVHLERPEAVLHILAALLARM